MGYIARAQLASAVSNAGAFGIIETSSGQLDQVRDEIVKMRDLTDKPCGVNIAQAFVRDPGIVDFVHDQGVRFVTTSAGDPHRYTDALHDAGMTVFHVVPNLHARVEGHRRRRRRDRRRRRRGRRVQEHARRGVDGAGAAGVLAGRRAGDRGRRHLRRAHDGRRVRARRRGRADGDAHGVGGGVAGARQLQEADRRVGRDRHGDAQPVPQAGVPGAGHAVQRGSASRARSRCRSARSTSILSLYFDGDLDAAFAFGGQVAGRIDEVRPVAEIIQETIAEFHDTVKSLAAEYS